MSIKADFIKLTRTQCVLFKLALGPCKHALMRFATWFFPNKPNGIPKGVIKPALLILSAGIFLFSSDAQAQFSNNLAPFFLVWNQDVSTLHYTTLWTVVKTSDLSIPMAQWTVVTNVWFTNLVALTNQYATTNPLKKSFETMVTPTDNSMTFYAVGTSNFSGTSGWSNITNRPAINPADGTQLTR